MRERFCRLARSAAEAADVDVDIIDRGAAATMHDSGVLRDLWRDHATAAGVVDRPIPLDRLGSSDMGDVSWVVPTIHPQLAICDEGVAGHSIEFRDAAASPRAEAVALLAATLVAQTAWDLLADPSARRRGVAGAPGWLRHDPASPRPTCWPATTTSTSRTTRATSTSIWRWLSGPAARSWSSPRAAAASPCRWPSRVTR